MLPKPKNIDQYIKSFPAGTQKILQQIRAAVKNTAPAAEEVISYSVAAFKLNYQNCKAQDKRKCKAVESKRNNYVNRNVSSVISSWCGSSARKASSFCSKLV